jgi:hypothetical protein
MAFSKDDLEKIYSIKEKLQVTFKAAGTPQQKRRISTYLTKIDDIIKDIEDGKSVDLSELNLFSEELIKVKISDQSEDGERISYLAKVENLKIAESNKDSEMDLIYSFLIYFEKNFSIPLGSNYLKIDYYLSKKRDTFFAHYEGIKHLLKEYTDDLLLLSDLKFNEQIEKYKARIAQQKKYFFIRLSELLHELKEFFDDIIADLNRGRKSFFNPDEKFVYKFETENKPEFEGEKMSLIIEEAYKFTIEFIEILRMPKFKKSTK